MTDVIVLDAGPLGLLAHTGVAPVVARCSRWAERLLANGTRFAVPEIADYEVRRELLRLRHARGLSRLEAILDSPGVDYLPVTTPAMRLAAEFWARTRQQGRPTADPRELDCDVVIAAQARLAFDDDRFIVATTNVRHLSPFVPAAEWWSIGPKPE